ncbi:MAG: CaiB/BaiF CoA-transferase family protein [Burkholderiales bacterium]|jgi:crotonobetainyl-CoA:carnitine CoA-transferase CaiB-like acyl-CoA transferase
MKMPLEDVTVLDLSHALAGPHCSTMLADFGARVIKLETPGAGDIARAWGSPLPGGENSYFVSLHRNKQGISIDLKTAEGKELFFKLVEKADVVLENFRPGALEKLGLGYERARERNPGIIYCSVSGFGQDGPYRERAALDLILQAESGMISVTGEEGGHGVRCGVSIADLTAGMYAGFGIVMALRVKDKTGEGQRIDVSMLEGQMSLLNIMISGYLADRELPRPMGTAYKALLPYQTFRTQSRDLALAVGSEKLWKIFCPVIGRPDLTDDPRFRTNQQRAQNRAVLIDILQQVFLTRTFEAWEAVLLEAGVPVGAINDIAQLVEHPQVKARGTLVEMEHPRAGPVKVVGVPVRLSRTPGAIRSPSPRLGEHTEATLRSVLGLPEAEIARLVRERIVQQAPSE